MWRLSLSAVAELGQAEHGLLGPEQVQRAGQGTEVAVVERLAGRQPPLRPAVGQMWEQYYCLKTRLSIIEHY